MKGDKYYPPITIKVGNNTAKIYRPILTDEERERRMQRIADAAVRLIMSKEIKDPAVLSRIHCEIVKCDSD